ncbi:MAG: Gfo/Idh/MocA family oxidoreductase [Cytophagales bacterium]|nr:Gfo/Idh/MocA family oxidoreductase [Cytophagales bacterium]
MACKPRPTQTIARLLENKDIDVVIIGTPDHWHCLQMAEACEAGKDVYVEKPVGRFDRRMQCHGSGTKEI